MSVGIINMISKIRNACMVGKACVDIPTSKYAASILMVMKNDGYIADYVCEGRVIKVTLKYYHGQSVIRFIKSISTPRKPVYCTLSDLMQFNRRFSTTIVSTNRGILAHQDAIAQKVGGQLICEVSA